MTQTVFHAFNWQFSDINKKIDELAALGFHALQISPAQQCRNDGRAWYLRYQPYDYSVLSGLGSERDLESLCQAARQSGIFVVADLVFNHMAGVCDATEARLAWDAQSNGDPSLVSEIEERLDTFPQFEPTDFHPFVPISGLEYDDDAKRFKGWGGAGTWPDLRPTPKVLTVQKQHIDLLYKCGVRGFRFDAVKQLFATEQYAPLVTHCLSLPDVQLVYGEVLSTQAQMHAQYSAYAPTTDFVVMQNLVAAFETEETIAKLCDLPTLGKNTIQFARNHDTVMQFLPSLSFNEEKLAALAGAYLLARADSSVLVLAADLEDPEFDSITRIALDYRKFILGQPSAQLDLSVPQRKKAPSDKEQDKFLWITHGELGGVFVNATPNPVALRDFCLQDFALQGHYEIQKQQRDRLGIDNSVIKIDKRSAWPGSTGYRAAVSLDDCVWTHTSGNGQSTNTDDPNQDLVVDAFSILSLKRIGPSQHTDH